MRRFWIDNDRALLTQINLLWKELPQDLRPTGEAVPATTVVFEAVEFIKLLRSKLDVHDLAERITEFDDFYDDRVKDRPNFYTVPPPANAPTKPKKIAANPESAVQFNPPPVTTIPAPTLPPPVASAPQQFAFFNGRLVKLTPTAPQPLQQPRIGIGTGQAITVMPLRQPNPVGTNLTPGPRIVSVNSIREPLKEPAVIRYDRPDNTTRALDFLKKAVQTKLKQPDHIRHSSNCLDTCPCKEKELPPDKTRQFRDFATDNYKTHALKLMQITMDDVDDSLKHQIYKEHLFYTIFDLCSFNIKKLRKFLICADTKEGKFDD